MIIIIIDRSDLGIGKTIFFFRHPSNGKLLQINFLIDHNVHNDSSHYSSQPNKNQAQHRSDTTTASKDGTHEADRAQEHRRVRAVQTACNEGCADAREED